MKDPSFPEGLLFHGTIEPFKTRISASDWEGVLWVSETPEIAQSYCPESGVSALWSLRNTLSENFIPRSDIDEKIFESMGFCLSDMDIQKDKSHKIESYMLLENHPKGKDVLDYIQSLGYHLEDGSCWIKLDNNNIKKASWKKPARLFIFDKDPDLSIIDISDHGDGGLTGRQWENNSLIKSYETTHDGVVVSDIHSSPKMGQFEHKSIALFPRALEKIKFYDIKVQSHDPYQSWHVSRNRTTPEFQNLVDIVMAL